MDNFIAEIFQALALKESENSSFVIEIYDEKNIIPSKSDDKTQVHYIEIFYSQNKNFIINIFFN